MHAMTKTPSNSSFYLALSVYCIITFLSLDMFLPALPSMARDLGLGEHALQYTITVWFLGSASLQLFLGPVADYIGRKPVFLWGIVFFIASSLLLASTTSYGWILLGRFVQGATVCSTMVAGLATVHTIYSGRRAVQVMAVFSTITILAPALGPLLGAAILHVYGWQVIFLFLALAATVSLFVHGIIMPDTQETHSSLQFRVILQQYSAILFHSAFMRFVLVNVLLNSVFFMWIVESPFIIIERLDQSALSFGLVQIPIFAAFILGGQITKYFATRMDVGRLVLIGISIALGAAVMIALGAWFAASLPTIVAAMTVLAIGAAMTAGPLNRYAIVASDAPTGSKVALSSAMTSVTGVLSSGIAGLFNHLTFWDLSLPIIAACCMALMIFVCADKPSLD
jgi:Bcr/CflA subfamily drug resistance transporter